jgi:fibronectin type 3 domain-containing protein
MKNGSMLDGKILSDRNQTLVVRRADNGMSETVRRSDILRIIYTDLYLGKVYIRMANGEIRPGYIVDEDAKQYTVRSNITKIEEYKIPRSKVMFVARSNPMDLNGIATTMEIILRWVEPFVPGKKYRVYLRENTTPTFSMISEQTAKHIKIRNLRGDTKYTMYVTAIDAQGVESFPSEQITISTLNTPPRSPRGVTKHIEHNDLVLSWQPAEDIDGSVHEYEVSVKTSSGEYERLGVSPKPSFAVRSREFGKTMTMRLIAFDNSGASSSPTIVTVSDNRISETVGKDITPKKISYDPQDPFDNEGSGKKRIIMGVLPVYMHPYGLAGKVIDNGFGVTVTLKTHNFLYPNLQLGLDTGLFRFSGKDETVKKMIMIPVMAYAGYRLIMGESFSVLPSISMGGLFMTTEYEDATFRRTTRSGIEAAARLSISAEYLFSPTLSLSFGAGYMLVYEKIEMLRFAEIHAGVEFRVL